ncbi:Mitochondrial ribonuclease P protein 1-like protein [Leptotrombidium deliense]|uniref:RNA (guanine-9-)-methyltransferase domain-containing protein 1 n=1 Tax=Leptotrombidium deliense TaxID=299467 RepID=A0A443STS4_9ACAR|nr:Mitochondrial ribonuclease P protein 1-like protein [Leptotrombidium deliense]
MCLAKNHTQYSFGFTSKRHLSHLDAKLNDAVKQKLTNFDRFQRNFEKLTVDKYSELVTNETVRESIQEIIDIYEREKYLTALVPETITVSQMQTLLKETYTQRLHYFKYLYKKEMYKRKRNIRKQVASELVDEIRNGKPQIGIHYDPETNSPVYGLWKNSLFINLHSSYSRQFDVKLYNAVLFGQPLVFDFSFESQMNSKCLTSMCKQIAYAIGVNRTYDDPFSLWFCNLKQDSETDTRLLKTVGNLYPKFGVNKSFINVHNCSYLDSFQKDKLVYLTPDSDEELHAFDSDAVYIIGAYVDQTFGCERRATIEKAKSEGLRTAKLPLDHYVHINAGKALNLDQVLSILYIIKHTNCWVEAFQSLPKSRITTKINT